MSSAVTNSHVDLIDGRKPRVLVAMSGGVDSSVAAAVLKEQGYDVVGATMQVWDYTQCEIEEGNGTCCSSSDVDDARSVADKIGIPFYVINCEEKFKSAVIDPFVENYLQGLTPLPCVNCNTFLKFDHLIRKMKELECDFLATGHYAQIKQDENGSSQLITSTDSWKDQTYFLFTLEKEFLPKILFPIGHLNKPQVRELAEKYDLVVAQKKDSTGICFVGNMGYDKFIESQVDQAKLSLLKGKFRRYPTGEVMGDHEGYYKYTYGQSKGFGLTHHEKMFVIKIEIQTNTVWLGEEKYLYSDSVTTLNPHFIDQVQEGEELTVKLRYAHKGAIASVHRTTQGIEFKFKEPQRAVTPGQAAVMYRGSQLVGGSWIV